MRIYGSHLRLDGLVWIFAILLILLIRRGFYDSVDIFCFGVQLLSLLLLLLSLLLLILIPAPAPDIVGAHSVSTTDVVSTHTSVPHPACQRPSPFYAQFEDLALVLVVFCD